MLDAGDAPAGGASGNAAGLFHGVLHADDGVHARSLRAAALLAARKYAELIAQGVPGRCDGFLRLAPEHAEVAPLARLLADTGLPPDYVQAWTPAQVRAAGGRRVAPAWFYPGGGWIAPAALVRACLRDAGRDVARRRGGASPRARRHDGRAAHALAPVRCDEARCS